MPSYKMPKVDPKLKARYLKWREDGGRPSGFPLKPTPFDAWAETHRDHDSDGSWKEGDVTYVVKWKYEEDQLEFPGRHVSKGRVCHIGKYRVRPWADKKTREKEEKLVRLYDNLENCVDRFEGNNEHPDRGREYRYIELANGFNDFYFSGLWGMGYSKRDCDLMARRAFFEDVKRVRTCGEQWSPLYIELTAEVEYVPDVVISVTNTLGSVGSDEAATYKLQLLYEIYRDTKAELEEKLKRVAGDLQVKVRAAKARSRLKKSRLQIPA